MQRIFDEYRYNKDNPNKPRMLMRMDFKRLIRKLVILEKCSTPFPNEFFEEVFSKMHVWMEIFYQDHPALADMAHGDINRYKKYFFDGRKKQSDKNTKNKKEDAE